MFICVCAHVIRVCEKSTRLRCKKVCCTAEDRKRWVHARTKRERKKEREWLDVNRCKHIHTNTQIYDVNTDTKRYTKWSWREPGAPKTSQGDCRGNKKRRSRTLRLEHESISVSEPATNRILLSQLFLRKANSLKREQMDTFAQVFSSRFFFPGINALAISPIYFFFYILMARTPKHDYYFFWNMTETIYFNVSVLVLSND